MAKAPKQTQARSDSIGLQIDPNEVVPPYFANQFNVVRENGYIHVNIGCLLGRQILRAATVIMPEETVFMNQKETIDYFNKMSDVQAQEATQFMHDETEVFYGQLFAFARNGNMGEMNPIFFRLNQLAMATAGGTVQAWARVSINTPIAVQLGIVKTIYIDELK